jgi:hypothetical protein
MHEDHWHPRPAQARPGKVLSTISVVRQKTVWAEQFSSFLRSCRTRQKHGVKEVLGFQGFLALLLPAACASPPEQILSLNASSHATLPNGIIAEAGPKRRGHSREKDEFRSELDTQVVLAERLKGELQEMHARCETEKRAFESRLKEAAAAAERTLSIAHTEWQGVVARCLDPDPQC